MFKVDYNPDVLSCLANLSNDEVFTPPALANEILDMLPKELWTNKETTFLDPVSKSGVFLREIAKRLIVGLEDEMPDMQTRVNHILKNQLFGIAITELTSLLSRRSLYCSKTANGKYSICDEFDTESGNILFDKIQHTWKKKKCEYCGASQAEYDRDEILETHAYHFIHTDKPEEIFNMKFDVIVGNPPYQLSDGGFGASATPVYNKFVQQAKKLNPRFLSMIIPSRWFAGGRVGELTQFREEMLNDTRVRIMHDFIHSNECFPGVEIKGGVNYFLWDRDNRGLCKIYTHFKNNKPFAYERPLLEEGATTFIRYNESISILRKVLKLDEEKFSKSVSANDPFGYDVRVKNSMKRVKPKFEYKPFTNSVEFYYYGWQKKGIGYINKTTIRKNAEWVKRYKVYITKAYGAGEGFPHQILNKPILGQPSSCCAETYLLIGPFSSKNEAQNVITYIKTKFFRFIVLLKKNTQEARKAVYQFVPTQDFTQPWTDEKLYKKYDLNTEEINFIESMVRPMEIDNG